MPLRGRRIVVCVTGSVAAIETPKLVRELRRKKAAVHCVMSKAAQRIIHPDVLEWASDHEVVTELNGKCQHVKLAGLHAEKADLILVAPCTANSIGKIAAAIDDTPVTTTVTTAFGSKTPIMLVPAMHLSMYQHPLVQENMAKLQALGVEFVLPRLEEKKAKLPKLEEIIRKVELLFQEKDLKGRKIVVTAGPTREALDEIRFLSNKSSGRMGLTLAEAAFRRGAEVTLIKGSTHLKSAYPFREIQAETAAEMLKAVKKHCQADILIHCAAVSDFTVKKRKGKISSQKKLKLELMPAPKILEQVKKWNPRLFLVGFKAEHNVSRKELIGRALKKLKQARADLIVANDLAQSMGSAFNEVILINKKGKTKLIPRAEKSIVAHKILDELK